MDVEKEALPEDIFSKIRRIEIESNKIVNSLFSGEYHSAFKGSGIEFAEVRPYQEGDDVRSIDWNVTARTGDPFIKVFDEERELTVVLAVDASASGNFGTIGKFKIEVAAEICATLAFSAIKNSDRVGLLIFTDEVELYIPPNKGRKHVLRIIREVLYFKPKGKATSIRKALERINLTVKRKSIVFLLSDFKDEGYEKVMRVTAKRHDLVAIEIYDPAEKKLPSAGLINIADGETGEVILIDSANEDFRNRFEKAVRQEDAELKRKLRMAGVDHIETVTDAPPTDSLVKFFRQREKRKSHTR